MLSPDAKPAPFGPFVCPICLDPIAQAPADILARYASLSSLLARADAPGGPRSVEFREILGHCEGRAPDHAVPTPCGHVFHARCLSLSLAHAAVELDGPPGPALACPLCRTSLLVRVTLGDPSPCLHGSTGALADHDPNNPESVGGTGTGGAQLRRFSHVRGLLHVRRIEALRLRLRRPRQRHEWWWAVAAGLSTALAVLGLGLVVLKFGFPGRVNWL
jgi:hypothetical protein